MNGKKTGATVLAVLIVAALIAGAVRGSRLPLSPDQARTLKTLLIVCACSMGYCFAAGELTHNYSQMDKLWSLLPIAYSWITAAGSGMKLRPVVYALVVTVWGVRLTVNFARKGAYRLKFWTGNEDYRWSIVHQYPVFRNRLAWTLFDLLFISVYQNALVLAICLPSVAIMGSAAAFGAWDVLAVILALAFLALETVSDEYQWRFHQTKKRLLEEKGSLEALPEPYRLGFNTTGPWAYMRHPNYLGEQGFWISLYAFVIGAGTAENGLLHWSVVGPFLLILLFMGSSALGESITSGKYPEYEEYRKQVFKYLPIRRFRCE